MTTTKPQKSTAYELLTIIQKNLKAPKSRFNSFGKYNYRSLEDILEGLKPHLPDGSYVNISDEIQMVGNRFYVMATASFCYDGACISSHGWAREDDIRKGMHSEQITGCTSSYARKYALNGLFLIDDAADADAGEAPKKDPTRAEQKPAQQDQTRALLKKTKDDILSLKDAAAISKYLKDNPLPGLSEDQVNWLDEVVKEHQKNLGG